MHETRDGLLRELWPPGPAPYVAGAAR